MSTYDIITDAPGLLRSEAINIQITFQRTGPNTGRVSWNIPTPAAGCAAGDQAYCGMLVTLDTTATTIDKTPKDGTIYSSDPTADANLFAGDKLGSALVIGAYYNDRTTVMFDVSGLMPNTPYFVTGFPADCQGRYFVQGVHAYSQDYTNRGTDGTNGTQVVVLNSPNGVKGSDYTGLMPGIQYSFTIQLGVIPKPNRPVDPTECIPHASQYTITIDGTYAQTYDDLVAQINKQFATLGNCAQGPYAPNTGAYYWNSATNQLFMWNGSAHVLIPTIIDTTAPNGINSGDYWYNPSNDMLSFWNGTMWVITDVIDFPIDPVNPAAGTYWYDGTYAYEWNGTTWCRLVTYNQATDPSLAVSPPGGAYWYNPTTHQLYQWNNVLEMWSVTDALELDHDPSAMTTTDHWFDLTHQKLFSYDGGWIEEANVAISEQEPLTPAPGKFWYNPTTGELQQRNVLNTGWNVLDVITYPTDPTIRQSCDTWWNTATDDLYVWNVVTNKWILVKHFYQQTIDPSMPPVITDGQAWYNTDTEVLSIWTNVCWKPVDYIKWPTDPSCSITIGTVWHDKTHNTWFVRTLDGWSPIVPVTSTLDPRNLPPGTFWYNPSNLGLQQWNGMGWVTVTYSTTPLTPQMGTCWYDTSTGILKEWNGMGWVQAQPKATVELDCNGNLTFTDTSTGSLSYVNITDGTLFKSLDVPAIIHLPNPGTDGASSVPSYDELGIGTDGNDAIRNSIINEIRYELGYPTIAVELTKDQMDYAINKALEEIRSRSSIAYKRGFFFMHILENQQRYFLTNKVQGMNKIVDIMGVYRMNSAFLSSAHGSGVYGQIVMQHMYNMGTFDLLSFHLMAEYTSLMEQLFATRITFNWNEQTRELHIFQRFSVPERMVCIEATVERTEQDIMSDRYIKAWIRKYAAAVCRTMLAEVRGKFASLPGASGSVVLNASELRQTANEQIAICLQEIEDYIVDKPDEYGMATQFIFG